MDMNKYKTLFLQESDEHIDSLNAALVTLEQGKMDAETIHSIFRNVHSIKGMSASMGYDEIKFLSHKLETFLDRIRKNEIAFTEESIACFADSVDFLGNLIEEVRNGKPQLSNPVRMIEQIEALLAGGDPKKKLSTDLSSQTPDPPHI
jgi:two-component system chemotaxis sensor kinase CheA